MHESTAKRAAAVGPARDWFGMIKGRRCSESLASDLCRCVPSFLGPQGCEATKLLGVVINQSNCLTLGLKPNRDENVS